MAAGGTVRCVVGSLASLACVLLGVAGAAGQAHDHQEQTAAVPPLYDDLGNHGHPITTSSSAAQAYFDQGLRLAYGFNHAEAIRAYRAALRYDADCAMCWWGIAMAAGPNINGPMDDEGGRVAFDAAARAVALAPRATDVERDRIDAAARRYAAEPSAPRPPLDSAYAAAMAAAAARHPTDPDVLTLYGAALMNLRPWDYWEGDWSDRRARQGTGRIIEVLGRAVELQPENPGACHYWIHLMEAAHPERAIECAERLVTLMPGAGHISHMPGHIYIRVGRYADAVRVNEHAVHSDEAYMMDMGGPSLYTGAYYPHNYHFMTFAATMAGMSGKALEAARMVAPRVPHDVARDVYWIQNAVVLPALTLVTFGRWQEVLDEPLPAEDLEQAWIMAWYARGVARAALGDAEGAAEALRTVEAAADRAGDASAAPIPHIARQALAGELALRSGDAKRAVEAFERAAAIEDALLYDEPPLWYYPIRHSLGQALLEAGRPAEAERAYRQELAKYPENGWSLVGLARSLDDQDRTAEADAVRERFRSAWADADVTITSSRR